MPNIKKTVVFLFMLVLSQSLVAQIMIEPKEYLTISIVRTKWTQSFVVISEKDKPAIRMDLTKEAAIEDHVEYERSINDIINDYSAKGWILKATSYNDKTERIYFEK